jgi:hypothetical protein
MCRSGTFVVRRAERSTLVTQVRRCPRGKRGSLPIRFDRSYLDRAPETRRRNARGHLDRSVEVIGLEDVVTGDGSLGVDERAVCGQCFAVLHPDGGCVFGKPERKTGGNTWRVVDRCVLGDDGLACRPPTDPAALPSWCPGRSAARTASRPPCSSRNSWCWPGVRPRIVVYPNPTPQCLAGLPPSQSPEALVVTGCGSDSGHRLVDAGWLPNGKGLLL